MRAPPQDAWADYLGFKNAASECEREAGYYPSRGFGTASNMKTCSELRCFKRWKSKDRGTKVSRSKDLPHSSSQNSRGQRTIVSGRRPWEKRWLGHRQTSQMKRGSGWWKCTKIGKIPEDSYKPRQFVTLDTKVLARPWNGNSPFEGGWGGKWSGCAWETRLVHVRAIRQDKWGGRGIIWHRGFIQNFRVKDYLATFIGTPWLLEWSTCLTATPLKTYSWQRLGRPREWNIIVSQLKIRTQEIEARVQVAQSNVLQFWEEWQVQVRSKCRYQHARGASSSSFWSSRSSSRNSNFSRGSSPTRSSCRRGQGKEISKIPCCFFKSGKYKRGDTCPFMYETSAPAARSVALRSSLILIFRIFLVLSVTPIVTVFHNT